MLKTVLFPYRVARSVWSHVPLPWQLAALAGAVLHFRPRLLEWEPYAVAEGFVWRCVGSVGQWTVHDLAVAGVPALLVAALWGRSAFRRWRREKKA